MAGTPTRDRGCSATGYGSGHYATEAEANAVRASSRRRSSTRRSVYTGQDGDATTGPWVVHALTVDFRAFTRDGDGVARRDARRASHDHHRSRRTPARSPR